MGGGGKGGSRSQTTTVPEWIKAPALRNITRAETAQKIGYMPYYGPEVAAFNPTQQASFNANINAAEAFGLLAPGSLEAMQGMTPEPQTFEGGLQAYSSAPLFEQALQELKDRRPGQVKQYDKLFVNTETGEDSGQLNKVQNTTLNAPFTIAPRPGGYVAPHLPGGANNKPLPYGWSQLAPGSGLIYKANIPAHPKPNTNFVWDPETGWSKF